MPPIHVDPLPYETRLQLRPLSQVDLVVIHCTELPDLAMARSFGERVLYADTGTGTSGHFYVDRDGGLHRYVAPERVAHHTRGYNPRSIGIELVNTGRWPNWFDSRRQTLEEPYPSAQIASLVALLQWLASDIPSLRSIAGHDDLDTGMVDASDDASIQVRRKRDPGPLFPWASVLCQVPLARHEETPA